MFVLDEITSSDFGLDENAVTSSYYIRVRAGDAVGNIARWSLPVSVYYLRPVPTTQTVSTSSQ